MSSYVPPHARRAQQPQPQRSRRDYVDESKARIQQEEEQKRLEKEKKLENTEENFPTLVTQTRAFGWGANKKSFATLATEWSEKAKEDQLTKQIQEKEEEEQRTADRPRYHHSLPKFHNVHRFVEPEDDSSMEELPSVKEDDGWVTVQRKVRREKTIQEKFNRPETPPENTAWNSDEHPTEHETCWDEKRY